MKVLSAEEKITNLLKQHMPTINEPIIVAAATTIVKEFGLEKVKCMVIEETDAELLITDLQLPSRVRNSLLRNRIETVAQLCMLSSKDLYKFRGIGRQGVVEIVNELEKMGLRLRGCN